MARKREGDMNDVVHLERVGATGLIGLNNPPVNAASHALRQAILEAVEALEADPKIDVIALYGKGRSFIAGADIREFGKPPKDPWLPALCNRLEACAKPVISVLHGAALGGGLEVALATHARIAVPGV
ncbi:MAG: enoyl-CoA hydratase/isomerase family protein, partial [Roseicyclus sp.]|nr:enoyl-CoA hydratase/isomerase family protein [Roseicyclus sp.]